MSDPKYNFGSPSKMKGLLAGEKATLRFLDSPETVDTEWGVKYSVPILLLTHPSYPSLSSKGMQMDWQTGCTVIAKTVVPLLEKGEKEFLKDYKELTWEIEAMEDGSIWLTNA